MFARNLSNPIPRVIERARGLARDGLAAIRDDVRRLVAYARRAAGRAGAAVERVASAKIERKVKPPIVAALVAAGLALVVAVVAAFRK
jgi:hypothetical protein